MKKAEATGKTIEAATDNGLKMLNLTAEQAEVEVVEVGGGLKKAKVIVTEKLSDLKKAENFLEELIQKMNLDCIVAAKEEDEVIYIEIVGKDSANVIGYRGEVLDSLQYLTNLYVNGDKKNYVKITVDAENYRQKRKAVLVQLAQNLEKKVVRTNKYVKLEPMNPSERRIIHSALQDSTRVRTESQGEEPNRFVVIYPKVGGFNVAPEPPKEYDNSPSVNKKRKSLSFVYSSDKKRK